MFLFSFCLYAEGRYAIFNTLFQIKILIIQDNLALFHARHVQNIVDQIQKLTAGIVDFIHISPYFFRVIGILAYQLGQSENGIERGTHIVGHVVEKGVFGFFASFGVFQRIFQQFPFFELLLFFLVYLTETEDDFIRSK